MIAFAYPLLFEAFALSVGFAILWLSFWVRDRRHHLQRGRDAQASSASSSELADPERDLAAISS
jgi:hypothetical protein